MACTGHVNSCPSHSGYVPPRVITFTNVEVAPRELIDLEEEVRELLAQLNTEATRMVSMGKSPIPLNLAAQVKTTEIRQIRDLYLHVTGTTAVAPYTNTEITAGSPIKAITLEAMKDGIISFSSGCVCQCNYACTCNCNYACTCNCAYACTCNCNYCTCNCNYCTCNCAYACTCNCNYSCTCNCAYSCKCNCNYCTCNCNYCTCNCNYRCQCNCNYRYSDIRFKTEIVYF